MPKTSSHLSELEQRLIEACDELWDGFVDPREPSESPS
jgi:hypothetical protein